MPAPSASSSLCTSCGLCCNGAIFRDVPVAAAEVPGLRRLGLAVAERDGAERFAQPCAMLRGTRCTIYESRPNTCRSYRCRVLAARDAGELGDEEARAHIARARALVSAVEPHLREGQTLAQARSEWAERRATGRSVAADADRAARAPFDLAMTALNLYLDRHFRIEAQKMVVASPMTSDQPRSSGTSELPPAP